MNKVVEAPLAPAKEKCICPEHRVLRMMKLILAGLYEPLFLVREGRHRYTLTTGQISRLLKKWCKAGDIDPVLYTAHFLSRGGLTWVHNARVTGEALQILGDWASKAYMRYIDLDFDVMLVNIDFGFSCRNSTAYQRMRKSWEERAGLPRDIQVADVAVLEYLC